MNTELMISDDDLLDHFFSHMQPGGIYVDVGAYNGDTIERAIEKCSDLDVIGIEPLKELYDEMVERFRNHHSIKAVNKACWKEKSIKTFYEYTERAKGLSTIQEIMTQLRSKSYTGIKYDVEVDTIDNILNEYGIDTVDYLKIDAEGAEAETLAGFTKYYPETLFHIETHIFNLAMILQVLMEMGASINKITLHRDKLNSNYVLGTIMGDFTNVVV